MLQTLLNSLDSPATRARLPYVVAAITLGLALLHEAGAEHLATTLASITVAVGTVVGGALLWLNYTRHGR